LETFSRVAHGLSTSREQAEAMPAAELHGKSISNENSSHLPDKTACWIYYEARGIEAFCREIDKWAVNREELPDFTSYPRRPDASLALPSVGLARYPSMRRWVLSRKWPKRSNAEHFRWRLLGT
jgi:hypothetical protein